MSFTQLILVFLVFAMSAACVRYTAYRICVHQWRKEKRNFRILRPEDVLRYALPRAVVLTTLAWITVTCPLLAFVLAGAHAGGAFQRRIEA